MITDRKHIRRLLTVELQENIHILIDPKKKDSFSGARVSTWTNTVVERILYHLFEENKNN